MGDLTILRTLAQVRLRLTTARAVETGLRAALYAAAAAVLIVTASAAAYSFLPAWYRAHAYPFAPLALIPAAFLFGAALRLARPVSLRDAAIYLDRQAGLLERVATAYELSRRSDPDSGLGQLVCEEARRICSDFRPSAIFYTRRAAPLARYLAAMLLVYAAALFLPPYKTDAFLRAEARQNGTLVAVTELNQQVAGVDANPKTDPKLAALLQQAERAVEASRNHPEAADQARTELEHVKRELEMMNKTKPETPAKTAAGATAGPPQADNATSSSKNTTTVPGAAGEVGLASAVPAVPGQAGPAAGSTDQTKLAAAIETVNRILQNLPPPAGDSYAASGDANSAASPARSDSAAGPWAKIYNTRPAPLSSAVPAASHGAGPPATAPDLASGPEKSVRPNDYSRLPDELRDLARKYFSGDQP